MWFGKFAKRGRDPKFSGFEHTFVGKYFSLSMFAAG